MLPNTGMTIRVIFAADVVLFFGTRWQIIHHIGERERESEVLARNSYRTYHTVSWQVATMGKVISQERKK